MSGEPPPDPQRDLTLYNPFGQPLPGQNSQGQGQGQDQNQADQDADDDDDEGPISVDGSQAQNQNPGNPAFYTRAPPVANPIAPDILNTNRSLANSSFQGWLPIGPDTTYSVEGLPFYFADLAQAHPHLHEGAPSRSHFFYINDGPQMPGEHDYAYKARIRAAVGNMNIIHRPKPPGPDTKNFAGGFQNAEWKKQEGQYIAKIQGYGRSHQAQLSFGHPQYDANYEKTWISLKRERQAENEARRYNAVKQVRDHFKAAGYDNPTLPAPDPPEDSGDDLFDWGDKGPMAVKFRRLTPAERAAGKKQGNVRDEQKANNKAKEGGKNTRIAGSLDPDYYANLGLEEPKRQRAARETLRNRKITKKEEYLYPSLSACQNCMNKYSKTSCSLKRTGVPCETCVRDRIECIPIPVKSKPRGYAQWYPQGHKGMFPSWYRDRARSPSPGVGGSRQRGRSASPDSNMRARRTTRRKLEERERRGVPGPSGQSQQNLKMDGKCLGCAMAIPPRACDMGRPCGSCKTRQQPCQDFEYDEDGELRIKRQANVGLSAPGFSVPNTGAVGPGLPTGQVPSMMDAAHAYRLAESADMSAGIDRYQAHIRNVFNMPSNTPQDNSGNGNTSNPFSSSGYSNPNYSYGNPGPIPATLPTTQQSVQTSASLDPALFGHNLTPFSTITNSFNDQGLGQPASAASVLQYSDQDWASGEPIAAPDPYATPGLYADPYATPGLFADSPATYSQQGYDAFLGTEGLENNTFEQFDMNQFTNYNNGESHPREDYQNDADMLDVYDDFDPNGLYAASPPQARRIDPTLPLERDHATTQQYVPNNPNDFAAQQQQAPPPVAYQPIPTSLTYDDDNDLGPVLPQIPQAGSNDMLGYIHPCDEVAQPLLYWPNIRVIPIDAVKCLKMPTRRCEAFDHTNFFVCEGCKWEQSNHCAVDAARTLETTKHRMCLDCSSAARQEVESGATPLRVRVDVCSCIAQAERVWLCLAHRQNALARIEERAVRRESVLFDRSGGLVIPCPVCNNNVPTPLSNAWKCLSCGDRVVRNNSFPS